MVEKCQFALGDTVQAYKNVAQVEPLKNSGPRAKFRVGLWPDPALDKRHKKI